MASNYYVTSQVPTVQVLGQQEVVDVVVVGFATLPHDFHASAPVTKGEWARNQAAGTLDPIAAGIESWGTSANVIDAAGVEEVDASGLIEFFVEFTVSVEPVSTRLLGSMTALVRVPVYAFGEPALTAVLIEQPLQAAIDALNATAAL